jgi:hypothetical protein
MKKKFNLSTDMVDLSSDVTNEFQDPFRAKSVTITIRVPDSYRREFKSWCAQKGKGVAEVFKESFELLKKHNP